jgi:hypothetical protein
MYISLEEAVALIDIWKNNRTTLQLSLTRSKQNQRGHATVEDRNGASFVLGLNGDNVTVDLTGAEFNGDSREGANSNYGAYLVCEYRNGDICSLYAPRSGQAI